MTSQLLSVDAVSLRFGGVTALADVTFDVAAGEMFGIIGPNGAGKSSLINVLTGFYRATSGTVRLDGEPLTGQRPAELASRGVVRTFQNLGLFEHMTVLENVLVGHHMRMRGGIVSAALRLWYATRSEVTARRECEELLALLGLAGVRNATVGQLPYGTKKRVEFAKALAARPRCLLLDEPVAGLNSEESARVAEIISFARTEVGAAVVLIEHDVEMVMNLCDRVMVLDFGRLIALDTPENVRNTPEVIAAYIGEQVERTQPGEQPNIIEGATRE